MNNGEFRGASLGDYSALLRLLETRQQEMLNDLQQRLRDAREEWTRTHEVSDTADTSEVDARDEIQLELIRMKADTLHQIDDALSRVHNGTYGYCVHCRHKISDRRLQALPFAARCKECEEARETTGRTVRRVAPGSPSSSVHVAAWRL
jgi:DnaK suppressor protein